MKYLRVFLTITIILFSISCQEKSNMEVFPDLKNLKVAAVNKPEKMIERFSYIVGYNMGKQFQRDSLYNLDMQYFLAGMKMAINNEESLLNQREMDSSMANMQIILQRRQQGQLEAVRKSTEANKTEAFEFLAQNKNNPGVVTLPSGVEFKVLNEGSGKTPQKGDNVKMHVKSSLYNDQTIDDSFKRGQPIYAQIDDRIFKSWQEILPMMQKGSRWLIWSPPDLAFGPGMEKIPAGKLAIFEIEMLDFQTEPFPEARVAKPALVK